MLDDHLALLQRLLAYELDDPSHAMGFLAHLMRSNGWDRAFALRAMEEYKKFMFLALVANHQVSPSDQVDQVWHLHLLYTDVYWNDFCPRVLGRPLHHHPSRGGKEERERFHHLYLATIASYERFFGRPPVDLWPPADVRFGQDLRMQRGPGPRPWRPWSRSGWSAAILGVVLAAALALGMTLALPSTAMARGDENSSSAPSSGMAPLALVSASVLVWASRKIRRPLLKRPDIQPEEPESVLDLEQLAYLARGATGTLQVALAKLVQQGSVRPNTNDSTLELVSFAAPPGGEIERQLVNLLHRTPATTTPYVLGYQEVMALRHYDFVALRHGLRHKQLIKEPCSMLVAGSMAMAIIVIYPLLFPFHWAGLIGLATGLLVALGFLQDALSSRGEDLLKRHRNFVDHYDPLGRVALLGPTALSGGALDDLRTLMLPAASPPSDGGCGGCGC
ncbi:MAG: TIGR04222 domain-containing membrane protein [Cyanobium sp.]